MTEPNYRVLKFGNHPTEGLWNSRSFTRSLVGRKSFHEAEIDSATGGDFIGSVLIKVDDDSSMSLTSLAQRVIILVCLKLECLRSQTPTLLWIYHEIC